MIAKNLIRGIICLNVLFLIACNDDLSEVGSSIQPSSDKIQVYTDSFNIKASTIKTDAIYAKTVYGELGQIYDPSFGDLKADYICQFYCPDEFTFDQTPYEGKIDSVNFNIYYTSWIGDSLSSMQAKVYKVTSSLERNYYTNIDPKKYCDMTQELSSQTYTAYDRTVSDSIHQISGSTTGYYYPHVKLRFPVSFGQELYDATLSNPEYFKDQASFNQFFPGLYVTTSYGTGNVLNVDYSSLAIYYKYAYRDTATDKDTLLTTRQVFNVTKEVVQMNRIKNTDIESLLAPNDSYTYIKSPAGVNTKLKFPIKDMISLVRNRVVNNFPLVLNTTNVSDESVQTLQPPSYLLLIPEDSVTTFFENSGVENNENIFLSSTYSETNSSYTFSNIYKLLETEIENNSEADTLNMVLIPVERNTATQASYYSTSTTYTTSINNYMRPAGVKIKTDNSEINVAITTSEYPLK